MIAAILTLIYAVGFLIAYTAAGHVQQKQGEQHYPYANLVKILAAASWPITMPGWVITRGGNWYAKHRNQNK